MPKRGRWSGEISETGGSVFREGASTEDDELRARTARLFVDRTGQARSFILPRGFSAIHEGRRLDFSEVESAIYPYPEFWILFEGGLREYLTAKLETDYNIPRACYMREGDLHLLYFVQVGDGMPDSVTIVSAIIRNGIIERYASSDGTRKEQAAILWAILVDFCHALASRAYMIAPDTSLEGASRQVRRAAEREGKPPVHPIVIAPTITLREAHAMIRAESKRSQRAFRRAHPVRSHERHIKDRDGKIRIIPVAAHVRGGKHSPNDGRTLDASRVKIPKRRRPRA